MVLFGGAINNHKDGKILASQYPQISDLHGVKNLFHSYFIMFKYTCYKYLLTKYAFIEFLDLDHSMDHFPSSIKNQIQKNCRLVGLLCATTTKNQSLNSMHIALCLWNPLLDIVHGAPWDNLNEISSTFELHKIYLIHCFGNRCIIFSVFNYTGFMS